MNIYNNLLIHFSKEKNKGLITSIVSFISGNVLNIFLNKKLNFDIKQSTFISLYIFANLIGYTLDILFAKEKLFIKNYNGTKNFYGKIPFNDYNTRLNFLIYSFFSKHIIRFIIISLLDSIIGLILLKYIINILDEYEVLMNWEYRDLVVAALVVSVTFNLYLNHLRFDWAYEHKDNFNTNLIIYSWFTITIIIIVSIRDNCNKNEKYKNKIIK